VEQKNSAQNPRNLAPKQIKKQMKTRIRVPLVGLARFFFTLAMAGAFAASAQGGTVAVTNTNDSLAGSLRQAIQDASPGDGIVFQIPTTDPGYSVATGDYIITLTTAELLIAKDLTIDGGGQKIGVRRNFIGGTPQFRVFNVTAGTVILSRLYIFGGNISGGFSGGGIQNSGTLTVRACTLAGNVSSNNGGAVFNNSGAAITLENCTLTGNTAVEGGAISNNGDMTIRNSTVFGNSAITSGRIGGIRNLGTARILSTIVGGNTNPGALSGPDVSGSFVSGGYNLIGSGFGSSGFGSTGDQVGATPGQVNLGPLRDYGGPTPTMIPLPGSFAIDQGKRGSDSNGQPLAADQRGQPRPVDQPGLNNAVGGDGSDVGAVENGLAQSGPTYTVTNTSDHTSGVCSVDDCTLFEAVDASNSAPDASTINFAPGVTGTILNQVAVGLTLSQPVTINGPGAPLLSVTGADVMRLFAVVNSAAVTISGLTIAHGGYGANAGNGAAITVFNGGALTLFDCTLSDNKAFDAAGGGAIYSDPNTTTSVTRCTFLGNTTNKAGGAIFNNGILTVTNCTFFGNTALNGGAIISKAQNGASSVTLRNCTITRCYASDVNQGGGSGGGGIYAEGNNLQYHFSNTIIAGNFSNFSNGSNPDLRGNVTSDGNNFVGKIGFASGLTNGINGDQIGSGAGIDPMLDSIGEHGGPTYTFSLLASSSAINAGNDALAPSTDQRGYPRFGTSDIGAFEVQGAPPTPTPTATPSATPLATPTATPGSLGNISTRLRVLGGDNALIGGMIATGTADKKVIIRAIGPTLTDFGLPGALQDPTLELFQGNTPVASNDDWRNSPQQAEIANSGFAPNKDAESAIIATLTPNQNYTAIVRGKNGQTGIGVVEAFDLDQAASSKLGNISTRGFVDVDDNVMIAGLIVSPSNGNNVKVLVRALGPTLGDFGVPGVLANPTLDLVNASGTVLRTNDNWKESQRPEIEAAGLAPSHDEESVIIETISPGAYTAIVRGSGRTTGIGLVEVYNIP
jgi:hypothetical protein